MSLFKSCRPFSKCGILLYIRSKIKEHFVYDDNKLKQLSDNKIIKLAFINSLPGLKVPSKVSEYPTKDLHSYIIKFDGNIDFLKYAPFDMINGHFLEVHNISDFGGTVYKRKLTFPFLHPITPEKIENYLYKSKLMDRINIGLQHHQNILDNLKHIIDNDENVPNSIRNTIEFEILREFRYQLKADRKRLDFKKDWDEMIKRNNK